MLLGRKLISPSPSVGVVASDKKRYTIDYEDWLDTTETLSTVTFAVDAGPATITSSAISSDSKSVSFIIHGAVSTTTPFNVYVQATSSAGQIKNDHIEFDVVPA